MYKIVEMAHSSERAKFLASLEHNGVISVHGVYVKINVGTRQIYIGQSTSNTLNRVTSGYGIPSKKVDASLVVSFFEDHLHCAPQVECELISTAHLFGYTVINHQKSERRGFHASNSNLAIAVRDVVLARLKLLIERAESLHTESAQTQIEYLTARVNQMKQVLDDVNVTNKLRFQLAEQTHAVVNHFSSQSLASLAADYRLEMKKLGMTRKGRASMCDNPVMVAYAMNNRYLSASELQRKLASKEDICATLPTVIKLKTAAATCIETQRMVDACFEQAQADIVLETEKANAQIRDSFAMIRKMRSAFSMHISGAGNFAKFGPEKS